MGLWAPNSIPASAPGPVSAPAFPTPARPPLGQAAVPGLVPVWPSVHGIPVTSLALTPVWLDVSLRPFWPQQPGRVPTQNQPSRCQRSRVPSPPTPHCFPPAPHCFPPASGHAHLTWGHYLLLSHILHPQIHLQGHAPGLSRTEDSSDKGTS